MYLDSRNCRVLLRDGKSIVSPTEYARAIVEGRREQSVFVLASKDTDKYEYVTGNKISAIIEDIDITPNSHTYNDDEFDELLNILVKSKRYKEEAEYLERLEHELEFFISNENIGFLLKIAELIDKFKEDGIVWGVGRGSGSASLVLYLLEVHDIDPIKYNIDFSEMSKEKIEYD